MSFAGIEDLKPMARGTGPGVGVNPQPIIRTRPLPPPSDSGVRRPHIMIPMGNPIIMDMNTSKPRAYNKYYCTFGRGQKWEGHYYMIEAQTDETARSLLYNKFGDKYNICHSTAEAAGVDKYKLIELTDRMIEEDNGPPFNPIGGIL